MTCDTVYPPLRDPFEVSNAITVQLLDRDWQSSEEKVDESEGYLYNLM